MERVANTYGTTLVPPTSSGNDGSQPVLIDDTELGAYMTGKRHNLTPEMRQRVQSAMKNADVKTNLFFAAYAQKGMMRLARVMSLLDRVDTELLDNAWRIKMMDNSELVALLGTLSADRTRTVGELTEMSTRMDNFARQGAYLPSEDEESKEKALSRGDRKDVLAFFEEKVKGKSKRST